MTCQRLRVRVCLGVIALQAQCVVGLLRIDEVRPRTGPHGQQRGFINYLEGRIGREIRD